MKRDWKIIKDILCAIEDNKVKIHWEQLQESEQKNVLLHYELLKESELITNYELASDMDDDGKCTYHPNFLPQAPNVPGIRMTMKV